MAAAALIACLCGCSKKEITPENDLTGKAVVVEACWKSEGFNGYVSSNTVYANYKADGYQPLGMGNL